LKYKLINHWLPLWQGAFVSEDLQQYLGDHLCHIQTVNLAA